MLRNPDTGFAEGKVGDSVQQDPNFIGWMDRLAHPNSPAGGGGPGEFTPGRPVAAEGAIIPAAETPGPRQFVPMQAEPANFAGRTPQHGARCQSFHHSRDPAPPATPRRCGKLD